MLNGAHWDVNVTNQYGPLRNQPEFRSSKQCKFFLRENQLQNIQWQRRESHDRAMKIIQPPRCFPELCPSEDYFSLFHSPISLMNLGLWIFLVVSAIAICDAFQGASIYVTQPAAPATSGGPGITVKQWNATGSNNQTTQFTLAVISISKLINL